MTTRTTAAPTVPYAATLRRVVLPFASSAQRIDREAVGGALPFARILRRIDSTAAGASRPARSAAGATTLSRGAARSTRPALGAGAYEQPAGSEHSRGADPTARELTNPAAHLQLVRCGPETASGRKPGASEGARTPKVPPERNRR